MAIHRCLYALRRPEEPFYHLADILNARYEGYGVTPVVRHIIDDIGSTQRRYCIRPRIVVAQPIVNIDNLVSDNNSWHHHLP